MASTRYYILANYTSKAMAGMIESPSDRAAAVKKACKAAGAKFVSLDLCRGKYDVVSVIEADSYDKVLGMKMAVLATGSISELYVLEAMDPSAALAHAAAVAKAYQPAG